MAHRKLVVIGGGAAGFFCAVNAARMHHDVEVVLLEKSSKLLSKVKVSGGGRCNVTHACFSIAEMVKKYPRGESFVKKSFHQFFTTDTIEWFKERGVALKTEADGRIFPITNNSQTIVDCMLAEASKYEVEICMNAGVEAITKLQDQFVLTLTNGKTLQADCVCVAAGGNPKATHFDWLVSLGHSIQSPVPSLFTFNLPGNNITALMGVTVPDALVKIAGTKVQQQGPLLITHWGMSGPAILRTSAWAARVLAEKKYAYTIIINWLPAYNEHTLKEKMQQVRFDVAAQKILNRNPFGLPARLWEYFLKECCVPEGLRWADLPAKEQNKLVKILCAQEFEVKGKTTFKEEFVTAGGISLAEIDPLTMESKIVKNLFFAGEIMDIDGITGGFNFQNAWTTGWIAAKLGESMKV